MRAPVLTVCCLLAAAACTGPQDDPTNVHDLRVLGLAFAPPEVLIPACDPSVLLGLAAAASATDGGTVPIDPATQAKLVLYGGMPLHFSALIADPAGNGRLLDYRVLACASTTDRQCNDEGQFVELARSTTTAGQLDLTLTPGLAFLNATTPLLLEVVNQDTFKGLGGIRLPVVLELQAHDTGEHVYAQKLMVYACQFFPEQEANVQPVLPGVTWNGERWAEDEVKQASGTDGVIIEPVDFSALQEPYIVPSIALQPVPLVESWKLNAMSTFGTFANYELGGTGFNGMSERYRNTWNPDTSGTAAQDVTFWFVVRDGRGGESWITRHARWSPAP